jgi:cysteine synthase A
VPLTTSRHDLAKLECMNPRQRQGPVAAPMIARREEGPPGPRRHHHRPTSGNPASPAACAAKGYRVILTMPDTNDVGGRSLISAYGAELS